MKGLAAIGAAGLIAAAGALWFSTSPNVIAVKVEPMRPNPNLPSFKQVEERALRQQNGR